MMPTVTSTRRAPTVAVVLILATMTLAAIPSPVATAQDLPASLYTLEGYVYDNLAKPLPDATVTVYRSGSSDAPQSTTTDGSGKYSIASLAAGTYNVTASGSGFVAAFVPVKVAGADSRIQQSFLLRAPDQEVFGVPLTLQGVVLDEASGDPMAGVAIEIWSYYYPSGGYDYYAPSNSNQVQNIKSAADGSYSVVVSEGSVSLSAIKSGYDILRANFEIRADKTVDLPMKKSSAQSITISGTVKSLDGKPLPDAWINVQPDYSCYDGSGGAEMSCASPMPYEYRQSQQGDVYFYYEPSVSPYNSTMTDQNGKYELKTMPGRVLVMAQANEHLQKQEKVEAKSGEKKSVDFSLEKIPADSVRIHGRVVDAQSGDGISYAQLNLENQKWGHYNYTQTSQDGSFELWTKPGYTLVTASAYAWYYGPCESLEASPESTWVDPSSSANSSGGVAKDEPYMSRAPCDEGQRDREYLPRVFTINAEEGGSEELQFKLLSRPLPDATFQGYVVNESSQQGIPNAQVSFYNELTRDYGQATTDEDGSYKIQVHGGYYTVRVWAQGYFDVVDNPEIAAGETKRLDLFATPGERNYYGYCCYAYASSDGYATKEMTMTHSAGGAGGAPAPMMATSAPASMGASSDQASSLSSSGGRQAYMGAGGGLGPYSPASEDSENVGGRAPATGFLLVAVVLLAGAILVARRKE